MEGAIERQGRSGNTAFTDPALSVGVGVWFRLGANGSLRQDARAQVVMRAGSGYTVALFALQVGRGLGH